MKYLAAFGLAALCMGSTLAADKEMSHDEKFVMKASEGGLAEVNAGMMAEKMAHSEAVKKYAMHMVKDHAKANKELNAAADEKKLKVATAMSEKHSKMAMKMEKMSGKEFDMAYIHGQIKDHEEMISLFEKESKHGSDADLKAWAKKMLPDLKHHLKMAKEIHGKMKAD